MLISPRSSLSDIPRMMLGQILGYSGSIRLAHKIDDQPVRSLVTYPASFLPCFVYSTTGHLGVRMEYNTFHNVFTQGFFPHCCIPRAKHSKHLICISGKSNKLMWLLFCNTMVPKFFNQAPQVHHHGASMHFSTWSFSKKKKSNQPIDYSGKDHTLSAFVFGSLIYYEGSCYLGHCLINIFPAKFSLFYFHLQWKLLNVQTKWFLPSLKSHDTFNLDHIYCNLFIYSFIWLFKFQMSIWVPPKL